MNLISWNIQWARGVDGTVDLQRIVDDARRLGEFDVLCLQEVAAHFPQLAGSQGENQFEQFAALLPGFTGVWAAGVDVIGDDGVRRMFGNMILSRYPVLRVARHQLPWPVDAAVISMPRVLIEATLDTPLGPVRVMNTHLEYHSATQRAAQVDAIRKIHEETCLRAVGSHTRDASGSPYHVFAQPTQTILTGDFNFRQTDALHTRVQQPFDGLDVPRLLDSWVHLHGEQPHPLNVGVYDREQWEEAFTCDFIYVSEDLVTRVRDFRVDGLTRSSDHQPQLITLS